MRAVGFFFVILYISLSLVPASRLWAFPKSHNSQWNFAIGTKAIYKSGISDANTYYYPFVKGGYHSEYLGISSEVGRYVDFQITDGYGTYDYVNINQAELTLDVRAVENLNMSFGCKYYDGESEYSRMDYLFEITYDFEKISLIGDYNLVKAAYDFHSMDVELKSWDSSIEVDYLLSDLVSINAGYTFNSISFSSLDYDYTRSIWRIGTLPEIYDSIYAAFGLSLGRDSDDYTLGGIDFGINAYCSHHIRLMVLYQFMYYQAPEGIDGGSVMRRGEGMGSSPETKAGEINPYLSDSRIGESYSSHAVSIGITFSF
jgi:hypothetical protein